MIEAEIEVEVLLFAAARDAAGVARAAVALPAPATAGAVLDALIARHPALAPHRSSLRLAVNQEYADPSHPVAKGDEVAVIPPTCGG